MTQSDQSSLFLREGTPRTKVQNYSATAGSWKYDARVRQRAVFLQDYDQDIARHLVQSVDVWLNVPRGPLKRREPARKVAINGG